MDSRDMEECIHCKKCTKHCEFLGKYDLDLAGFSKRRDLAYHCFMCGVCTSMCPKHIDGKLISQQMREKRVALDAGKVVDHSYRGLLWEKNPYKFANYSKGHAKTVLFPGCNFPSFYPKTTKYIERLLQPYGIGIIYECCGKPVAELGMTDDSNASVRRINEKLKKQGVTEVIMLCPNCMQFLKGKLDVRLISIYEKLHELGLGKPIKKKVIPMYYPCPDRESKEFMKDIRRFMDGEEKDAFPKSQCCGLGGCASVREKELAAAMVHAVTQMEEDSLYTYCASCVSNFRRGGIEKSYHVLPLIAGIEEEVPLGMKPLLNRALCKISRFA